MKKPKSTDYNLFKIVKKSVEKLTGLKVKHNYHIAIRMMEDLAVVMFFKKLVVINSDNEEEEVCLTLPESFRFDNPKDLRRLQKCSDKLAEWCSQEMQSKTGARTDTCVEKIKKKRRN